MDKEYITELISSKLRLIRAESGYTQEKMANVLGMSKKTLVQIEKGRSAAGWAHVVAVCALFRNSEVRRPSSGMSPLRWWRLLLTEASTDQKGRRLAERCGGGTLRKRRVSPSAKLDFSPLPHLGFV